jgi:hypothetical protein
VTAIHERREVRMSEHPHVSESLCFVVIRAVIVPSDEAGLDGM